MSQEFESVVLKRLGTCFPSTREWLVSLRNLDLVVDQWQRELAEYSTELLVRAIEAIRRGDYPAPRTSYERDEWPKFIAHAARSLRWHEKREKERINRERDLRDYVAVRSRCRELGKTGLEFSCREEFAKLIAQRRSSRPDETTQEK